MAGTPFFTAAGFTKIFSIPDTNAVTIHTAAGDEIINSISFANSHTAAQKIEILINDIHFTDINVTAYSGYDNSGTAVARFEAFEEGFFPTTFENSGFGNLELTDGDTVKVKAYSGPTGTMNVAITGKLT